MLISLEKLIEKYNIQFKGILHIGAHECEELKEYEKYISRNNILWVEALSEKVNLNKTLYPNLLIEEAVVSDKIEKVTFNISNNGQSSSFLEFGLHTIHHPQIVFTDSFEVETKILSDILKKYTIEFNFINIDIQGAELKALKGMEEYLHKIDYIYTEVNSDYVYKGCCLITEIDEYLNTFGFERIETEWWGECRWGDAFYIRKI
jgi:FkbM family methyltransferase